MNVPKLDAMLRPILALSVDAPVTRVSATESMALHFGLSAEDRQVRIPSGKSTYVRNRVGWAMTFLTKGGLIEKVAPRQYRRHRTWSRIPCGASPGDYDERLGGH